MNKSYRILLLVAAFTFSVASARIIEVPGTAFPTIQSGIDSSLAGDTILVSDGTYLENINFNGKNIVVASRFLIDGDIAHILGTTINGSQPIHPDSASCVRIVSHEDSTALLTGFTLTGGRGTKWRDIHNILVYREGGGILIELSSPTIRCNLIIENEASDRTGVRSAGGGGIRAGDGNPLIENNVIALNLGRYGAGIVLNYATGRIRNNIIWRNSGGQDYGGGGIWSFAVGPAIIENNTIVENSSTRGGGGLTVWSTSIVGRGNILWGNTAVDSASSQIELISGSADMTWNDVQFGWEGEGNITAEPLFDDFDFHLASGSPCIDAGPSGQEFVDPEDPGRPGQALWPSMGTSRNDMGAFGGPHRRILPSLASYVSIADHAAALPGDIFLLRNYPNPFNSSTSISFLLPEDGPVKLAIFDITGREIGEVSTTKMNAGPHVVTWQAGAFASGAYLCRLTFGKRSESARMTLVK